jgi:hypothetical protein
MPYVDPLSLRDALNRYYDETELRTLCFDLAIDYESLGGRGKAGNAQALVAYVQRLGRIDEVAAYVRRTRPHAAIQTVESPPPLLAAPTSEGQPTTQTNYTFHGGTFVGSAVGGGTVNAQNIAGGDIHINTNPQDKADFEQQLQALKALLEQALAEGQFADAADGQTAIDDADKALKEAAKDTPRLQQLQNRLESITELIKSGAKAGSAVLKATPIIGALIKAAQGLFS